MMKLRRLHCDTVTASGSSLLSKKQLKILNHCNDGRDWSDRPLCAFDNDARGNINASAKQQATSHWCRKPCVA